MNEACVMSMVETLSTSVSFEHGSLSISRYIYFSEQTSYNENKIKNVLITIMWYQ